MIKNCLLFLFLSTFLLFSCSKDHLSELSSENEILSFSFSGHGKTFFGNIDNSTKEIIIETEGLELINSVVPSITISQGAFISPDPSIPQNFNNEVNYTITAENGEVSTYTITIQNIPFSDEKKILQFEFDIDNESFIGNIDHDQLFITIETYKNISYLLPLIEISENATISTNSSESQDFNDYVQYTITAQNGTSNTYTVETKRPRLVALINKCYIRAISTAYLRGYDLSDNNFQLYLENENNSYLLNYINPSVRGNNENPITEFMFEFNEDIITANDYKLRLKDGNRIIAEEEDTIDVLAEGAPKINSVNQSKFSYGDTLIITGTNLFPALLIPANSKTYLFSGHYITINSQNTELSIFLDASDIFPFGQSTIKKVVSIYLNDRYADGEVLLFE